LYHLEEKVIIIEELLNMMGYGDDDIDVVMAMVMVMGRR
jgi:hypothetical protein